MDEAYTFHEAVHAIDLATITGRPFPRSLRDNGAGSGEPLLCLDWSRRADRDAWLDFFDAVPSVDPLDPSAYSRWSRRWHGWTVLMTAPEPCDDSGAGVRTQDPAPVLASLDPDATVQFAAVPIGAGA